MIQGQHFDKRSLAGEALLTACKQISSNSPVPIGEYRGFSLFGTYDAFFKTAKVKLRGTLTYTIELGDDGQGATIRLDNGLKGLPERLASNQEHLADLQQQMDKAREELKKPFPQEQELREKSTRLAELNAVLSLDKASPAKNSIADLATQIYDLAQEYDPGLMTDKDRSQQIDLTAQYIGRGKTREISSLLTEIRDYGGTEEMARKAGVLLEKLEQCAPQKEKEQEIEL